MQDDGQDEGQNQGVQIVAVGRPDQGVLHHHTEHKDGPHRQHHGHEGIEPHGMGEEIGKVAGQDVKLAVGEVDHVHDAHHERHA